MQFITVSLPPPGLDEAPDDWITKLPTWQKWNHQGPKSVNGKTATLSQENAKKDDQDYPSKDTKKYETSLNDNLQRLRQE